MAALLVRPAEHGLILAGMRGATALSLTKLPQADAIPLLAACDELPTV